MQGCEFGWKEGISVVSSLATWGLVYLGWWKVHQLSLDRERRKEKRESAAKLLNQVRSIEQEAIDFHRRTKYDEDLRASLIYSVSRVSRLLQQAPYSELAINNKIIIAFRQSITLKNADPTEFKSQSSNSLFVHEIRTSADELVDAIELAKERLYA